MARENNTYRANGASAVNFSGYIGRSSPRHARRSQRNSRDRAARGRWDGRSDPAGLRSIAAYLAAVEEFAFATEAPWPLDAAVAADERHSVGMVAVETQLDAKRRAKLDAKNAAARARRAAAKQAV